MKKQLIIYSITILIFILFITACNEKNDSNNSQSTNNQTSQSNDSGQTSNDQQDGTVSEDPLVIIETSWENSPHANTYVVDSKEQNNDCAQCHSPINWMPTLDNLPESCFVCKFEVSDPEPYISESEWESVKCMTCHKFNKKGEIEEGIFWLEIAPLEQYADVETSTELCTKCHLEMDNIERHPGTQIAGAHEGYNCDDCHDPHSTSATCSSAECHSTFGMEDPPVLGHDDDHQLVTCVACHDADGLDVGPNVENAWFTFLTEGEETYQYSSHNVVLAVDCERCHYPDNPWDLSDNVTE